jgi:hypothetical protein
MRPKTKGSTLRTTGSRSEHRLVQKNDTKRVTRKRVLPVNVPRGSRFKAYTDCLIRDLVLWDEVVRYRRECWMTTDGDTVIAPHACSDGMRVWTQIGPAV